MIHQVRGCTFFGSYLPLMITRILFTDCSWIESMAGDDTEKFHDTFIHKWATFTSKKF